MQKLYELAIIAAGPACHRRDTFSCANPIL